MTEKKSLHLRPVHVRKSKVHASSSEVDRLHYERRLWEAGLTKVIGVDEAGRGPLAGPVVAAAVMFRPEEVLAGVDDSKRLTSEQRLALFPMIISSAVDYGVGIVSAQEIDVVNILQASLLAMRKAVWGLQEPLEHILVDGRTPLDVEIPQTTIIKGDHLSFTIAAASILAKVVRDLIMEHYHREFPRYGFNVHKGYPTPHHLRMLRELGPCEIHRRSFRPRALQDSSPPASS